MKKRKFFVKMIRGFVFNLMAILVIIVFASTKAYADETPVDPVSSQDKLYYFTDNPNFNYYLNGTIANNGYSGAHVDCYYYPTHGFDNPLEFEREINIMYQSNFFDFDNSIVIFEMREGLLDECYSYGPVFAQCLENIFSSLKEEHTNNIIMFICGTDEALFSNYCNFLNYVDIHVNTDIMSIFMYNVLKRIDYNTSNSNYTLILDGWCNPVSDILISKYLVPRYRQLYQMYAYNPLYTFDDYVLNSIYIDNNVQNNHYVQVIGSDQNSPYEYYDYANGYSYHKSNVSREILENPVYGLGTTYNIINFMDWMQNLDDCVNAGYNVEGYLYDIFATLLPSHNFDLYTAGYGLFLLDNGYLDTIMNDFINGNDLSIYDNYIGQCVITYKPFVLGPNGWMDYTIGTEYVECWSKYMNQEDFSKYHPVLD